jgi:hypothetical protein
MVRDKPTDQRCLHEFEKGKQCGQKINGQGARYYCSECRDEAQEQAKKERDRLYSANRREADPEGDNFYHWLYYHLLTEPQFRPLFERAEARKKNIPTRMTSLRMSQKKSWA